MDRSLSALLPVRNVESTLAAKICELLDVLPELTTRLELIVVDDCSRDATIEVADEIASTYPQIRVVRHHKALGRAETIRTAMRCSGGRLVFLEDEDCGVALHETPRLWQAIQEHPIVLGRPLTTQGRPPFGWQHLGGSGGSLMAFREALEPFLGLFNDQSSLRKVLARRGGSWAEIRLSPCRPLLGPHRVASFARRLFAARVDPGTGVSGPGKATVPPKRPNYLSKIKEFALGE